MTFYNWVDLAKVQSILIGYLLQHWKQDISMSEIPAEFVSKVYWTQKIDIYFLSIPPKAFCKFPTIPLRLSFFATPLKHSGHNGLRLVGRLSFNEPLICSNCGWILPLNFTEHFWHLWRDLSNAVCLMLIVRCSYFFLSTFSLGAPPKNDNTEALWLLKLISYGSKMEHNSYLW